MGKNLNTRRFTGSGPRPDRTKMKRDEAKERNTAWAALTRVEKIDALDARLGNETGAKRQRARLARVNQ